jgi:hypothetical protein
VAECNREPVLFSSLGRQEVRADFAGGTLTSDAGGLLLREVDRQLGLVDALSACLTDPRDLARVVHEQRTMLAQRIFGIALGYEDLNDHDELRRDPLFSVLAEQTPGPDEPLASSPTLCRLENRVARKALADMSGVFVEQFIASFDQPPEEVVLDFVFVANKPAGWKASSFIMREPGDFPDSKSTPDHRPILATFVIHESEMEFRQQVLARIQQLETELAALKALVQTP